MLDDKGTSVFSLGRYKEDLSIKRSDTSIAIRI